MTQVTDFGDYRIEHQFLEEQEVEGKRLGSHFHKDSRSKNYAVREIIQGYQTDPTKLTSRVWKRHTKPLDQGNLGSCTGNATTGMLATDPLHGSLPSLPPVRAGGKPRQPTLNEPFAKRLYEEATRVDGLGQPYPPNDRGSSTLGVLKGAQALGYINNYRWGFGFVDAANMLALVGAVITGVMWYEGFDTPQPTGELVIAGSVRGGHELELAGIDVENRQVWGWNSWGPDWDQKGQFFWSWKTYERLLADQGEVGIGLKTGEVAS